MSVQQCITSSPTPAKVGSPGLSQKVTPALSRIGIHSQLSAGMVAAAMADLQSDLEIRQSVVTQFCSKCIDILQNQCSNASS
ncbi:unnamed protein product [Protopolystoma xenopodis]|uniref:Uncharacterized protein n=1 Tax=Protopolystoma xenopodis TaxID=117903 RepID=A0A448WWX0_9PLAT|nr:unnamed protein product [Protopolystoma xenopodis]